MDSLRLFRFELVDGTVCLLNLAKVESIRVFEGQKANIIRCGGEDYYVKAVPEELYRFVECSKA